MSESWERIVSHTRSEHEVDGVINAAAWCWVAGAQTRELTPRWLCHEGRHRWQAAADACQGRANEQHPCARLLQHLSNPCSRQCVINGLVAACTETQIHAEIATSWGMSMQHDGRGNSQAAVHAQ